MKGITENEILFLLTILKSPETQYNANSISKVLGISAMGALKIAKKLEKENILTSKKLGKAKFYSINYANDYAKQYIKLILKKEAEQSTPFVKRWINELKKIKSAELIILFGSVIKKEEKANDVDVLIITEQKKFDLLKKEIEEINLINQKKIHPLYQSSKDFKTNIQKADTVVINAIKGIFIYGEDFFIEAVKK